MIMLKDLVKTKTFWGGIASIATGIGMIVSGDTEQGIQMITLGIISIFLRDAVRKGG